MIRIKVTFGDKEPERVLPIKEGEALADAIVRISSDLPLGKFTIHDIFVATVNGIRIPCDQWTSTNLAEKDEVIITPNIKSGDSGQLFKQAVIIAVTIAVSAAFPPGASVFLKTGAVLAASIGTSLLMNALIPPPVPNIGDVGGIDQSQMYTVTGQSNQAKRYGIVPKVYGSHRIFPNVAAKPYVELSVDPNTNETAHYLYCIYDFGLGSPVISDIKIGDTKLDAASFKDYRYRLVDPNRPDIPQDSFDSVLSKEFSFYKSSRNQSPLSLALNEHDDESIQNTEPNPDGKSQEIILNFVAPQGLFYLDSDGNKRNPSADFQIDFAPVGTNEWKSYRDFSAVSSYDVTITEGLYPYLFPQSKMAGEYEIYTLLPGDPFFDTYYEFSETYQGNNGTYYGKENGYGFVFPKGNKIIVRGTPFPGQPVDIPHKELTLNGQFIGNVVSASLGGGGGVSFTVITLDRDVSQSANGIPFYEVSSTLFYNPLRFEWELEGNAKVIVKGFQKGPYGPDGSNLKIVHTSTSPSYFEVRFTPRSTGQQKVRVRRTFPSGKKPSQANYFSDITWTSITTAFDTIPIKTDKRHVFLELKIKATDQLNGQIENLSAVASQPIDVYDPDTETWTRRVTNNPAWIFCDLLTGDVNKKAVGKDRLHLPSILDWAEFCDEVPTPPDGKEYVEPRFQSNFILDFETTLQDLLNKVCGAAQASLNIVDGNYGVLMDKEKTVPVQVFTPRNSRDFSSHRIYTPRPHGLKISYIDPQLEWERSEVTVYDNGYDFESAIEFEEMDSFACTNVEQAWRFGRYMMAQNKFRQETISILVDFEHIICTRGDYVKVTQDVMQVGGVPARVVSVDSGTKRVIVDEGIDISPSIESWGYTYRNYDVGIKTSTLTPISSREFELDGDLPEVGDLIVIGPVDSITLDCIVKAISPNDDSTAILTLVERANEIFDYESEGEFPEYDPQISQIFDPNIHPPKPVINLQLSEASYECAANRRGYNYFAEVNWDTQPGSVYEMFEIWVNDGRGYKYYDNTSAKSYRYYLERDRLGIEHGIKVVAVSASGKKIDLVAMPSVNFTIDAKITSPPDVEGFGISITNQVLQLTWELVDDCGIDHYELRYSPSLDDLWESSVPLQVADRNINSCTVQARTGIYFIKAVDFEGNKSERASKSLTTIPNLFNLNIVETLEDFPDFEGYGENIELLGSAVVLAKRDLGDPEDTTYYEEGFYYLKDLLDLGDIFSARIQSQIRADGYKAGEIMSNWESLSDLEHLGTADSDDWDVIAEYRTTSELLAMSGWEHLSDIEHIGQGSEQGFTDWRPVRTIGDATGRVFQFRVRLRSLTPNVTPRLFSSAIRVDMDDRLENFENLESSATEPTVVTYPHKFVGPSPSPNIQVSIDDGETGDYWEFGERTLSGFTISFYDKNDQQVSRKFDVLVRGYGRHHTSII